MAKEQDKLFPYWHELMRYIYGERDRTKKLQRKLLVAAKRFLPEYTFTWWGGIPFFKAPYGDYVWHFCVCMKQEQIWNYPEFKQGYRFGLHPKEPYRDANPYEEPSRAASWDYGYIWGLYKGKSCKAQKRFREDKGLK